MLGKLRGFHGASEGGGVVVLYDANEDGVEAVWVGNEATLVPGRHCFCLFPRL